MLRTRRLSTSRTPLRRTAEAGPNGVRLERVGCMPFFYVDYTAHILFRKPV